MPKSSSLKVRTIRQTVRISAPPEAVYHALMDSKEHEGFTGSPAKISPKVGGAISAHGGYIRGKNLELVRGKKIVQAWVPQEDGWPEGHETHVTFLLEATSGGTKLTFTQTEVPVDFAKELATGWKEFYWAPLKAYLASMQA